MQALKDQICTKAETRGLSVTYRGEKASIFHKRRLKCLFILTRVAEISYSLNPIWFPAKVWGGSRISITHLSTNGLVLEMFENLLTRNFLQRIWLQHPNFSLILNFHIPRICYLKFMAIINEFQGIDNENRLGCNSAPSVIIHGQMPYESSIFLSS